MKAMTLFITLLLCTPAFAEFYEWTDGSGVVHFTDNENNIPAKFRSGVRRLNPSGKNDSLPPAAPGIEEKPYGGHPEEWWRSQFRIVTAQLQAAQDQLVAKKDEQALLRRKQVIFKRASDRVASNKATAEVDEIEGRIKELQGKLADLQKSADEVAVPLDWRQ